MKITVMALLISLCALLMVSWLTAEDQERPMNARFVIPEANLPDGFPKPSPAGDIVVKQYPTYRLVRTNSSSNSQSRMFRLLFQHIKSEDIAMTAPVEMTYEDDELKSMAFLYGSTKIGDVGQYEKLEVVDIPEMTVLSIGIRGSYNDKRFREANDKLNKWLEANNNKYVKAGLPRYFGYNSPFVPSFLRYGEVQIPIQLSSQ